MNAVELVIAATLFLTYCAFLVFPVLKAPALFGHAAITLCAAEFIAVILWQAGRTCIPSFCPAMSATAHTAATLDIPALTVLMFVLAIVHGVRVARTW